MLAHIIYQANRKLKCIQGTSKRHSLTTYPLIRLSACILLMVPILLRTFFPSMTVDNFFIYLVAYLSSYHEKAINALYELA